ncbi:MAG: Asp-tRNA(Asn)/Glu-tRNA(Gln) amidotransferase subunit GatC [Phycisphaerales bacterium]|nr:Asp-tRNA(Asn)/Glu-tRNA(Gln) amidotransferase subunit GatC [Phycisphaerales bacterium]
MSPPPNTPPNASPTLDESQIRHIAKLACLKLAPDDVPRYAQQLSSILDYVAQLKTVNVTGVEPMSHPLPLRNAMRNDIPTPALSVDQVLANAPAKDGPYFTVPKVLDTALGGS